MMQSVSGIIVCCTYSVVHIANLALYCAFDVTTKAAIKAACVKICFEGKQPHPLKINEGCLESWVVPLPKDEELLYPDESRSM